MDIYTTVQNFIRIILRDFAHPHTCEIVYQCLFGYLGVLATAKAAAPIVTLITSKYVDSPKDVPFMLIMSQS